jgi:hypothetical protein
MVNVPHRSAESIMQERISVRLSAMRRTAGAVVLALAAALIVGALLSRTPAGFGGPGLQNLIPLDDPIALSTFTA